MSSRLTFSILLPCLLALLVAGFYLAWGGSLQKPIIQSDTGDVSVTSIGTISSGPTIVTGVSGSTTVFATGIETTTPEPTIARFAYINITRQQYEEALAKWRAQSITEYEIVVDYYVFNRQYMGEWTLHVETSGSETHVISASRGGEKEPNSKVDFLTVEDMFREVEDKLDYVPDVSPYWDALAKSNLYWEVSFDPRLGYPSLRWAQQPDVHISDIEGNKYVKGVRIIKQNPPGWPCPTSRPVP